MEKSFKGQKKQVQERAEMIDLIRTRGIKDKAVLNAMSTIPRHLFIPAELQKEAYKDYPLPVGKGQTISQPYTVAFMLEALELRKGHKVLEIGTGSCYNAALIAEIVRPGGMVHTTEIVPELVELAKRNLKKLGRKDLEQKVKIISIDGSKGLPKHAPYDRIIATAACPEISPPWIEQLKNKGIIIAPVGGEYSQSMIRLRKKDKKIETENLGGFTFVPLRGAYGQDFV